VGRPRCAVDEACAEACVDSADRFGNGLGQLERPGRPAKERISTTLARIASPSNSGSLAFGLDLETMHFDSFYS
jgi:hypothetical protein